MHLPGLTVVLCLLLTAASAQQKYQLGKVCSASKLVQPKPKGLKCGFDTRFIPFQKYIKGSTLTGGSNCAKACYADYRCKSFSDQVLGNGGSICLLLSRPLSDPNLFTNETQNVDNEIRYYDRGCYSCTPTPLPKNCSKNPTLKNGGFLTPSSPLPWVIGGYPRLIWAYGQSTVSEPGEKPQGFYAFGNGELSGFGARKTAITLAQRINGCAGTRIKVSSQLIASARRQNETSSQLVNRTATMTVSVGDQQKPVQVQTSSENPDLFTNSSRIFTIPRNQPFLRFELEGIPKVSVTYQFFGVQLEVL